MEPTANEDSVPALPKGITRKPVPINPTLDTTPTKPQTNRSSAALIYLALMLLGTTLLNWRWVFSGIPFLTTSLAIGESNGKRVFSRIPLWAIITLLNVTYIIASTSWVLYWGFVAVAYTSTIPVSYTHLTLPTKRIV